MHLFRMIANPKDMFSRVKDQIVFISLSHSNEFFCQANTMSHGFFIAKQILCKTTTQNRQTIKISMTNGSLMNGESIAECSLEHSAIILTRIKQ